jgi:hypothetical protein
VLNGGVVTLDQVVLVLLLLPEELQFVEGHRHVSYIHQNVMPMPIYSFIMALSINAKREQFRRDIIRKCTNPSTQKRKSISWPEDGN